MANDDKVNPKTELDYEPIQLAFLSMKLIQLLTVLISVSWKNVTIIADLVC